MSSGEKKKRPLPVLAVSTFLIAVSAVVSVHTILVLIRFTQGRSVGPFSFTEFCYAFLARGFDAVLGPPLFFLYFLGVQAWIGIFMIIAAVFLLRGAAWARKFLMIYAFFNIAVWVLDFRSPVAAAVIALHAAIAAVLFLPAVKKYFGL